MERAGIPIVGEIVVVCFKDHLGAPGDGLEVAEILPGVVVEGGARGEGEREGLLFVHAEKADTVAVPIGWGFPVSDHEDVPIGAEFRDAEDCLGGVIDGGDDDPVGGVH